MEEKDHQHIIQYLEGTMSPVEKAAFEKRLEAEPDLAEALRLHKGSDLLVEESYRLALKDDMQNILKDVPPPEAPAARTRFLGLRPVYWGLAASILLLVTIGIYFGTTPPPHQQYFEEYFEVYKELGPARSSASPQDPAYLKAWDDYTSGNYQAALAHFDTLSASAQNYPQVQIYRGVSYIGLNNWPRAREVLDPIGKDTDSLLQEAALWYLGLGALQAGEVELAKGYFGSLQRISGYKQGEIEALFKKFP